MTKILTKSSFLSFACFIHCLLAPFIISIGSMSLFGLGMEPIIGLVIFSIALIIFIFGWRKHKNAIPIALLFTSVLWFMMHVKWGELKYSLVSSIIVFAGFLINNYLCYKCPKCHDKC